MSNALTIVATRNVLNQSLTIYGDKENPLFLAKDVANWIEHSNPRVMLESVDADEKGVRNVYTPGGEQQAWFLTESGLYEVLMLSRKPIAKQFKKEVKRILHELRTTGTVSVKQSELPLLPADNTISASELAIKLGISTNQIHGIITRNRDRFKDGTDIIKNKQLYFTPQGEAKLRSLAALTTFRSHTGFKDGEDVVFQEFSRLGYSPALYLTYLMLINWFELDDRKMFDTVSLLNRINRTTLHEVDPMKAAVASATTVTTVKKACSIIVDTLMDYSVTLSKDDKRKPLPLRIPQKMADEIYSNSRNTVNFRNASMSK